MKLYDEEIKENLLRRLHRLEGQIRGVEQMISEQRDCNDVLQQLSAVRSAMDGVTEIYLKQMITECMSVEEPGELPSRRKEMAEQLTHLVIHNR